MKQYKLTVKTPYKNTAYKVKINASHTSLSRLAVYHSADDEFLMTELYLAIRARHPAYPFRLVLQACSDRLQGCIK